MKHVFLIIVSLFFATAHAFAAPFDGETSAPFGARPFEGYQMRSVAPMSEEKTIDNITSPFQLNPSYLSTEPTATTTQSDDDWDWEDEEVVGPGVPLMPPLTMGWDVILLLITLAFIYAISIAQKRKKTTI